MKLNHRLLAILFLAMLLGSCEDNHTTNPTQNKPPAEEQLPPITTTGAGTFGCKVNGKVWVAKSNKTGWPPTYASINRPAQYETNISGSFINGNTDYVIINILFKNENKTDYLIGFNNDNSPKGQYYDIDKNTFWRTDSIRGGGIKLLRYDTLNQIISGTFFFDCINKETGDVLKITEGRFDMHYTY
jgi:hypothetical protein